MTQEEKVLFYDGAIADMDKKHAESLESQGEIQGNKLAVHTEIANRQSANIKYIRERERLIQLRNEAMPVSKGVADYIAQKKASAPASKFDLDNGSATLDDSLNPLSGKSL